MRLALALALVAAAIGVCADSAAAASSFANKGVLSMTPARRTLVGRPPMALTPTRVSNSTRLTMAVTVFPTLLVQYIDGSFGFNEDARDLNAAKLIFPVSPTRFTLKSGQEKELRLRWQLLPRTAKAGYFGLVVQGVPVQKGRGVSSVLRLLGVNFFTLPGHWHVTGKLTALRGQQASPGVLRFFPRVRNTGQIHSQPRNGHCKVVGSNGTVVLNGLKYGAGVVLPGYAREYPILIQKPHVLPAGSYVIKCSQRFGTTLSTRSLPFKLSGPNTLPTASLKLQSVTGSGEIGSGFKVGALVRNVGSKASPAILKVRVDKIRPAAAPLRVAAGRYPQGVLNAGASRKSSVSLGKTTAGNYRVTVVLSDGHTDLDEKTADFTATKARGFFDRLQWWWLLILLAILLVLWLLWRERRRQRELERELSEARAGHVEPRPGAAPAAVEAPVAAPPSPPPPPAAAPPSPPPPPVFPASAGAGRININSASVDELVQLPGVGRRAAERIVAHREAHGPFASLDDLHNVEGWHAERIRRIVDSASV